MSAGTITRLAIVGPKHSGKTTLASALVDAGWLRLGHADPLKSGAASMLNSFLIRDFRGVIDARADLGQGDYGYLNDDEIAANKAAFVPLLQWLGEWLREYCPGPDPLIAHLRRRIAEAPAGTPIVVDDVRLPEEADALREQGFFILRLVRQEWDRQNSIVEELWQRKPPGMPSSEWFREIKRRQDAINAHSTETRLKAITPDARVWCESADEVRALAARIASGEL